LAGASSLQRPGVSSPGGGFRPSLRVDRRPARHPPHLVCSRRAHPEAQGPPRAPIQGGDGPGLVLPGPGWVRSRGRLCRFRRRRRRRRRRGDRSRRAPLLRRRRQRRRRLLRHVLPPSTSAPPNPPFWPAFSLSPGAGAAAAGDDHHRRRLGGRGRRQRRRPPSRRGPRRRRGGRIRENTDPNIAGARGSNRKQRRVREGPRSKPSAGLHSRLPVRLHSAPPSPR
jgi:hypothetical protein